MSLAHSQSFTLCTAKHYMLYRESSIARNETSERDEEKPQFDIREDFIGGQSEEMIELRRGANASNKFEIIQVLTC